jgi:plastocyanin
MADMTKRIRLALIASAALAALGSPTVAFAQTKLIANVGQNDAFLISLTNEAGGTVRDLPAGVYHIEVHDHSGMHNFRLRGPGVEMATTEAFVGTVTWTVTLQDKAQYTFNCDPHPTQMRGSFTTGGGPVSPPPPPPPAPSVRRLVATVGPGATISLRTASGSRVTRLRAGRYRIVVRDRSARHNFHLTGPGVNKRTAVAFRGTRTWTLTLRRGRYRFVCDPHATRMRGSFRVT